MITLRHYRILSMMFIAAVLGVILDFITLCRLFQKSHVNEIYDDYKEYMTTRECIKAMNKLICIMNDLEDKEKRSEVKFKEDKNEDSRTD